MKNGHINEIQIKEKQKNEKNEKYQKMLNINSLTSDLLPNSDAKKGSSSVLKREGFL